MTVLCDTSVLIDYLRGNRAVQSLLESERTRAPLLASELTRLEVLAGMRANEESLTRRFLDTFVWCPLDQETAEKAGELGRRWLHGHGGIDAADLAIAATAVLRRARLLTRNIRHFPMFDGLRSPY